MKYVFVINSHTTFLTSIGTINYLNISPEDVIMLYMRNYANSIIKHKYRVLDFNDLYEKYSGKLFDNRKVRAKGIKEIDKKINENIGEKYHLYAPHYGADIFQVLYTHPLCVDGSYIQEGGILMTSAYVRSLSLYKKLRYFFINRIYRHNSRIWRPSLWYAPNTLYKQKEIHAFSISNSFFQYLPAKKHIVHWPKVNVNVNIDKRWPVFITDCFLAFGICDEDVFINSWKKLIEENKSKINYIKFHPQQDADEKKIFISMFGESKVIILDNSIPFGNKISNSN